MKQKRPQATKLRKRAIQELLNDPEWTRDLELETAVHRQNGGAELYAHPTGQLLVRVDQQFAWLVPEREAWIQMMMEVLERQAKGPQHVLSERLLYGREFAQHIPELIDALAQIFRMSAEAFDYNPNGGPTLETMTRKIRARGRMKCVNDPVIFSGLVAYLTETGRRAVNGRIQMIESWQSPGVWEPWILDPQDNAFNVYLNLYDTLYENEYGISLGIGIDIGMRRQNNFAPPPPRPLHQLDSLTRNITTTPPSDATDVDEATDE